MTVGYSSSSEEEEENHVIQHVATHHKEEVTLSQDRDDDVLIEPEFRGLWDAPPPRKRFNLLPVFNLVFQIWSCKDVIIPFVKLISWIG